jgi:RNA polymerase sigma factor for flagellar operon FliA
MLPLVKRVAPKIRKRLPAHVELDDLFSDGVLGLVDAVTKFDASKRVSLETYARHRIRGSILDGLRAADPASRDLRRRNQRVQKLYHELEVKLGRSVTDEEMAAVQGMNLAEWHRELNEIQSAGFDVSARVLSAGPTSRSVSRKIEPAFLAGDDSDPFDLCYREEQREILGRALSSLRERERQIITLHYYQQELPMKQIAEHMNVDESRISQLHAAALVGLKANVHSLLHPGQAETSVTDTLSLTPGAGSQSSSSLRREGTDRQWAEQPWMGLESVTRRQHAACQVSFAGRRL